MTKSINAMTTEISERIKDTHDSMGCAVHHDDGGSWLKHCERELWRIGQELQERGMGKEEALRTVWMCGK